jgi:hypothetical protein
VGQTLPKSPSKPGSLRFYHLGVALWADCPPVAPGKQLPSSGPPRPRVTPLVPRKSVRNHLQRQLLHIISR